MLYAVTPKVLELAAQTYAKDPKAAINLLTQYASANAVAWQQEWLKLGDVLLGKYAMGMIDGQTTGYPQWWNDLIGFKPPVR
jgi:dipeptidase